jgi:hypothetical protein
MEANASLRSLKHRLTGEAYGEYVKKLAEANGVDSSDPAAVRRFDRTRPGRKTSNDEWHNPHDPDARVGRTKRGNTRMIYKPEHLVDLETGAIVDADVRPGDEHDTEELTQRVLDAEKRMNQALGDDPTETESIDVLAADMGYFKLEEIWLLQQLNIETVIRDPHRNRRRDRLREDDQSAIVEAERAVTSESGKLLLKRRAEFVERSFEHTLDSGGARQTTLRGRENIRKRYLVQAACANLSLLMRRLTGIGTPKQALAASRATRALISSLIRALHVLEMLVMHCSPRIRRPSC